MGLMDGVGAAAGGFAQGFNPTFNARQNRIQTAQQIAQRKEALEQELAMRQQAQDIQNQQMQRQQATNVYLGNMMGGVPEGVNPLQVAQMQKALAPTQKKANMQLAEMDGEQGYGKYLVNMDTGAKSFLGGGKPASPQKLTGNLGNLKAMYPDATNEELYAKALEMSKAGATNFDLGKDPIQTEKTRLLTLANSGFDAVKNAQKLFFEDGYNSDLAKILASPDMFTASGIVGEEASQAYNSMYGAVQDKLRLESGAAIPADEIKQALRRYMPAPFDTEETAKQKINSLYKTLETYNTLGSQGLDVTAMYQAGMTAEAMDALVKGKEKAVDTPTSGVSQTALDLVNKYKGGQ